MNNTPVKHAVELGAERIIVIAPSPAVAGKLGTPSGVALVGQLADILLGERLYRDLRDAARVNEVLGKLDRLAQDGWLNADQHRAVRNVLGWRRHLELICIRPESELPGHAFSGLFDRCLREEYIAAGREAACSALSSSAAA